MKFIIDTVSRVEESAGFRVIGCLQSETEDEMLKSLPEICNCMREVLDFFAGNVQPEVSLHKRDDGISENSVFYRIISLPELAYVLNIYKNNLGMKDIHVELSTKVKYFPEEIQKIFEFQLQCWKSETGF